MRLWIIASSLLGTVLVGASPAVARADCLGPDTTILWSYPDESTPSVPPSAVFWAVAHLGNIRVEVDGVPLARVSSENYRFAPATPLSEGEHEFVAWSELGDALPDAGARSNERRVRFVVDATAPVSGDVAVDTVTIYPVAFDNHGMLLSPPPGAYDTSCSTRSVSLDWSCDDIIPGSLAQVTYRAEGAPIAYLVQRERLVPAGCPMFWAHGNADSPPESFRVAAVLPTGIGEEHAFAGEVEVQTNGDVVPGRVAQ